MSGAQFYTGFGMSNVFHLIGNDHPFFMGLATADETRGHAVVCRGWTGSSQHVAISIMNPAYPKE